MFRRNLRWLLERRLCSQRQAAEKIGVGYKWMRRLCHQGLVRTDRRTGIDLKRLADFFDVTVDDLWDPDLRERHKLPSHYVLIRWMGSKRRQVHQILEHFPRRIGIYYEPFLGGGSVLHELLRSGIEVERIRCSDRCRPLIAIWKLVQNNPRRLAEGYEELWERFREYPVETYARVRSQFNETGDPVQFFFLMRTCRNGMVRFSRKGKFTTDLHHGARGLPPEHVRSVIHDWHCLIQSHEVRFVASDYRRVRSQVGDFLYVDPPYVLQGCRYYFGRFEYRRFFKWLGRQRAGYALSLNGTVEKEDQRIEVPERLFDKHALLENGTSPSYRLNGMNAPRLWDSLYVRGPVPADGCDQGLD